MRNRAKRWIVGLALAGVALGSSGCFPVSFAAGWLAAGLFGTKTTCFENGVEVDCSSLPPDVQPK